MYFVDFPENGIGLKNSHIKLKIMEKSTFFIETVISPKISQLESEKLTLLVERTIINT